MPEGALQAKRGGLDKAARVARLEEICGYTFKDKSVAALAITHPSAARGKYTHLESYERLEFLGDAYVGTFIAQYLFDHYPKRAEGRLTKMKVSLVAGSTMTEVGRRIGLDEVIIFGQSESGSDFRGMDSALEDVFESVSAALVLDGGVEVARRWVLSLLTPLIEHLEDLNPANVKSQLQELTQIRQVTPEYRISRVVGPAHDRTFYSHVLVEGEVLGKGKGHSKKEAEAHAAAQALKHLQKEL
jgi:ribonuclease-3